MTEKTEKKDAHYNYSEVEPRILKKWQDNNCFAADPASNKTPYVIVIPPPNVTGRLHMGHALNNTFQDMLIRYKRMDGFDALWVPGTDHAGIATQTVVKKMLDEQGVDYRDLGRDKFVEKVWEWKKKYGDMILKQLASIGSSCDWTRTRFTMDDGLYRAVMFSFKKLYDEKLIYRGKRIVNWCPVDKTALSDDEVETKEGGEKGFLWHIKYPLEEDSGELVVATTRPETLFGDVAVAVNPKDKRYTKFVGKKVVLPLQGRIIPVIADEYVEMTFGTGCLKITPAHDPNDFEIGQRHKLEPINVMNEDATMNDVVPEKFRGLDRFKCREKAIEELKAQGFLVSEEERMTPLGRSYRSGAVIEYRLSDQWFVKMQPLAEKVLKKHSELNIQPERWNKVYLDWMNNIRDWCISRQIWWGHRIPAWFHKKTGEILVEVTTPKQVLDHPNDWQQETDVLDTWFSSSLWPMSTLGWPEDTQDFKRYFPTTTLVTAKDIIFFWVARMNIMSVHFTGKLPYKNVFINPIVLDEKGETMSKSKGNGIDPLVVVNGATLEDLEQPVREARPANIKEILRTIEKRFPNGFDAVGADVLRYTLVYLCSGGQQMKVSLDNFQEVGRRFVTKLWNAARFIMMSLEQEESRGETKELKFEPTDADKWMAVKCQIAVNKIRQAFENHDFTQLGQTYYQFFWNDFCDWYIELCKERLNSEDSVKRRAALHFMLEFFALVLKILHPVIPFVTEELWGKIPHPPESKSDILMKEEFPKFVEINEDQKKILHKFEKMQSLITEIRVIRKTYMIKEGEKLKVFGLVLDNSLNDFFINSTNTIGRLANLGSLTWIQNKKDKPQKVVTVVDAAFEIYLDISDLIDAEAEKARLNKEIEKTTKQTQSLNQRLQNPGFLQSARPEIVVEQKQKLIEDQSQLAKLQALLKEIEGW